LQVKTRQLARNYVRVALQAHTSSLQAVCFVSHAKLECTRAVTGPLHAVSQSSIKCLPSLLSLIFCVSVSACLSLYPYLLSANCAAGSYQASVASTSCSSCDAGKYTVTLGVSASSSCLSCSSGFYAVESSSSCTSCSAGTYQASTGSTSCSSCLAGSYSAASASVCSNCAAGTFQTGTNSMSCTSCSAGFYTSATGSTSCLSCSVGFSCPIGASSPVLCTAGYYAASGSSSCSSCASGSISSPGSSLCRSCGAGSYTTTGTSCSNCAAGTYTASSGSSSCALCPEGTYSGTSKATVSYPRSFVFFHNYFIFNHRHQQQQIVAVYSYFYLCLNVCLSRYVRRLLRVHTQLKVLLTILRVRRAPTLHLARALAQSAPRVHTKKTLEEPIAVAAVLGLFRFLRGQLAVSLVLQDTIVRLEQQSKLPAQLGPTLLLRER